MQHYRAKKGQRVRHQAPLLDAKAHKFRYRLRSEKIERFLNVPSYGLPWSQLVQHVAQSFGCSFSVKPKSSTLYDAFLDAKNDHGIQLTPASIVMPNASLIIRRLPVHYEYLKKEIPPPPSFISTHL